MKISIVVPMMNEEDNVSPMHHEIKQACEKNNYDYEIIFIDDGSSDKTVENCKGLSPLKLIVLRKNFGQTAAMDAGIKAANGDYFITMDGDLQNDAKDFPKLIKKLKDDDLDVVSGWRKDRKDSFLKNFVSRGANLLRKLLVNDGIHDSGCSLKIYKKECFQGVTLYGEMHRFIPAILKIKGYKVGEVVVNHRSRTAGITKYNWKRTLKGFIDMISVWFWNKYSARPLHLLGGLGLIFILLSVPCGITTMGLFIAGYGMSETAMPLLTIFLFLGGIQLFTSGLLADILLKNYFESKGETNYSISQEIIS